MTSFQESLFPSPQENGTYQSTSLGPSQPPGLRSRQEQQSTCTSTALIAAFPDCPHHTAQRGLHILTPSNLRHMCREASGYTRDSLQHEAELGLLPPKPAADMAQSQIPEEKIGIDCNSNVGRCRAGTMWEASLPGNTSFCFHMILHVIVWGTILEQNNSNSFYIWRKSGWNRPPAGYWGDFQSCLYDKWGGIKGISQPVSQIDTLFLHSNILKTTFQSNAFTCSQLALVSFVLSWPSSTAL